MKDPGQHRPQLFNKEIHRGGLRQSGTCNCGRNSQRRAGCRKGFAEAALLASISSSSRLSAQPSWQRVSETLKLCSVLVRLCPKAGCPTIWLVAFNCLLINWSVDKKTKMCGGPFGGWCWTDTGPRLQIDNSPAFLMQLSTECFAATCLFKPPPPPPPPAALWLLLRGKTAESQSHTQSARVVNKPALNYMEGARRLLLGLCSSRVFPRVGGRGECSMSFPNLARPFRG